MLDKPWWEIWPGREEYEFEALKSAGIRYQVDQRIPELSFLRLKLEFPWHGENIILVVDYPPLYPFFRPDVFAPPGTFPRHQNPLSGSLCLLGRKSDNWNSD